MSKVDSLIVEGVSFFASVHTPNKATGTYSIDLVVDADTSKKLQEVGIPLAKDKDGNNKTHEGVSGDVFRFKKKLASKLGKALTPPKVVDSQGTPMKELVGNGSKVRLYLGVYDYTMNGKSGTSAALNVVQVLDLVEFHGGGIIKEDGFTTGNTTDTSDFAGI